MKNKICGKCGRLLPLEKFVKHKGCKDGRAGTCKECQNAYSKKWKYSNRERLGKVRRRRYKEKYAEVNRQNELRRRREKPLRVRCQLLRSEMLYRSKDKNIEFDSSFFTVDYLMRRLSANPFCECCGRKLDITFKDDRKPHNDSPSMDRVNSTGGYTRDNVAILCWECNKHKQDATAAQLRKLADWMDSRE